MEWGLHAPITPRLGGTAERYRALAKSGPTEGFVHDLVLFRKRLRSLVVNLQLHSFVSSFPMSQIRQKSEGWGRSQPTGCAAQRRRSSLTDVGKDLREIQELLRHKNIRTTVRYTHVGYEQTLFQGSLQAENGDCWQNTTEAVGKRTAMGGLTELGERHGSKATFKKKLR